MRTSLWKRLRVCFWATIFLTLVIIVVHRNVISPNANPRIQGVKQNSLGFSVAANLDAAAFFEPEKPSRRLEFVHIPKTGGTIIESEAARHNITWSVCHFGIHENIIRISLNETICPKDSLKYWWPGEKKHSACPWWHVPPQYFEMHQVNPYAGADLFVVVRNPYERLLSEYFYSSTYITKLTPEEANNAELFNIWIERRMKELILRMRRGDIARNISGNSYYFRDAGHYIPQYDFVYEHRRRIVRHVIRFENLVNEFHALMQLYKLPIRLPQRKVRPSYSKIISIRNLTRSNLELIERLYQDDFREWGYEMLSLKMS